MWDRFIWWLYHDANAPAVMQTFTAIATVVLTIVLVCVTWWYARLTRRMALTMEQQLRANFAPDVAFAFIHNAYLTGGDGSEDFAGSVQIKNNGALPLKVNSLRVLVQVTGKNNQSTDLKEAELVIGPEKMRDFRYVLSVLPGTSRGEYRLRAIVTCTDLAGVSKHSFVCENGSQTISHYVGFKEI